MTPAGGMGAFHSLIDAIQLVKMLVGLNNDGLIRDIAVIKKSVAAFRSEMLKRGLDAVCVWRPSYEEAKKKAVTKQHFTRGLRPLSPVRPEEIVLKVNA